MVIKHLYKSFNERESACVSELELEKLRQFVSNTYVRVTGEMFITLKMLQKDFYVTFLFTNVKYSTNHLFIFSY